MDTNEDLGIMSHMHMKLFIGERRNLSEDYGSRKVLVSDRYHGNP